MSKDYAVFGLTSTLGPESPTEMEDLLIVRSRSGARILTYQHLQWLPLEEAYTPIGPYEVRLILSGGRALSAHYVTLPQDIPSPSTPEAR
jgi:hypothetical protein